MMHSAAAHHGLQLTVTWILLCLALAVSAAPADQPAEQSAGQSSAGSVVTGAVTIGSAGSDAAGDVLWPLLAAQQQASGRFKQELYSEEGDLLERSSGRYAILRPGFFRWEIDYPDQQQIIVADGVLWHHDIDLAAVSRRDAGSDSQFTPLELLAGDTDALRERFVVELLAAQRFRLQPTFAHAGFNSVDLSWEAGEIVAMDIRDRSGQEIRLALDPDAGAAPLTPADFEFSPPEGTEVYLQPSAVQ